MATDVNNTERRIQQIKRELASIGDMRPGSLSKQYNVCGNPRCQCKDPREPKRHGPYYQVSYAHRGKSTTQFIRPEFVAEVEEQLANYKRFKTLVDEWVDLALQHAKLKLQLSRHGK